jgi:hypothetical protein
MTSKLKCPFCGQELIREGMNHWWCSCNIEHQGKELYGTTALWQALIQAKQDLEIARKALEKARINLAAIEPYLGDEYILDCKTDGLKEIDEALETIGKHNE